MKNRLYKIMYGLEEIIEQIEDNKNVLKMEYNATTIENNYEHIRSALNVQIRLLEDLETDSRNLHNEIDKTILDLVHNRI